jgi:hypothetical protein
MAKSDGLGVLLALGGKSSKGGGAPEPDGDEGEGGGRELAASALIKAIKSGDAAGVADAFEELTHYCGGASMGEPDGDEE